MLRADAGSLDCTESLAARIILLRSGRQFRLVFVVRVFSRPSFRTERERVGHPYFVCYLYLILFGLRDSSSGCVVERQQHLSTPLGMTILRWDSLREAVAPIYPPNCALPGELGL